MTTFLLMTSSASIGSDQVINPFSVTPFKPPKNSAITESYRTEWNRMTGFELSGLHWNQFIVVYTDKGSKTYKKNFYEYIKWMQAFDEGDDYEAQYQEYPVGTVVLKENFTSDKGRPDLATTLTIMVKHEKGYSPKGGDWEYIESTKDGQVIMRGKAEDEAINQRCAACHMSIKDRDYIYSVHLTGDHSN